VNFSAMLLVEIVRLEPDFTYTALVRRGPGVHVLVVLQRDLPRELHRAEATLEVLDSVAYFCV